MSLFEGSRVLVTGGAGFIGSHLVEELVLRCAAVTIVDDLSTGEKANVSAVRDRVQFAEAALHLAKLDEIISDSSFDIVFHLAGHTDVRHSVDDPDWDLNVNGLATLRFLESIRTTIPHARFVYASSATIYAGAEHPHQEKDTPSPTSPTG